MVHAEAQGSPSPIGATLVVDVPSPIDATLVVDVMLLSYLRPSRRLHRIVYDRTDTWPARSHWHDLAQETWKRT